VWLQFVGAGNSAKQCTRLMCDLLNAGKLKTECLYPAHKDIRAKLTSLGHYTVWKMSGKPRPSIREDPSSRPQKHKDPIDDNG
jgi:hypothetical protein